MVHLKQVCDTRRQRKDGTYPIVFRITFNRQQRFISTGYSCNEEDWDNEYNCLKPKSKELVLLSERLRDEEYRLLTKVREFEQSRVEILNVQQIKNFLVNKQRKSGIVINFWNQEIKRMTQAQRFGNARNYKSAMGAVQNHMDLNIPFSDLDFKWLLELETKLKSSGLKPNSVSVYMRTIRAIYNSAINLELADANEYPFRRYKIKKSPTSPKVLSIEELKRFFNHQPHPSSYEYDAWNYGKLIFLLRGINFTDLAILTNENIKNNRIIYHRAKTGKRYSIELIPEVTELIELYEDPTRITLFPILSNAEFKNRASWPARIAQCRKVSNKWLKRMGQYLELEEKVVTYTFRYSYANGCRTLGYSTDMIGQALGHLTGHSVTNIYLEDFDVELIDEMHRHLIREILGD